MNTIQFELGGGASLALPTDVVAQHLIDSLRPPRPLTLQHARSQP